MQRISSQRLLKRQFRYWQLKMIENSYISRTNSRMNKNRNCFRKWKKKYITKTQLKAASNHLVWNKFSQWRSFLHRVNRLKGNLNLHTTLQRHNRKRLYFRKWLILFVNGQARLKFTLQIPLIKQKIRKIITLNQLEPNNDRLLVEVFSKWDRKVSILKAQETVGKRFFLKGWLNKWRVSFNVTNFQNRKRKSCVQLCFKKWKLSAISQMYCNNIQAAVVKRCFLTWKLALRRYTTMHNQAMNFYNEPQVDSHTILRLKRTFKNWQHELFYQRFIAKRNKIRILRILLTWVTRMEQNRIIRNTLRKNTLQRHFKLWKLIYTSNLLMENSGTAVGETAIIKHCFSKWKLLMNRYHGNQLNSSARLLKKVFSKWKTKRIRQHAWKIADEHFNERQWTIWKEFFIAWRNARRGKQANRYKKWKVFYALRKAYKHRMDYGNATEVSKRFQLQHFFFMWRRRYYKLHSLDADIFYQRGASKPRPFVTLHLAEGEASVSYPRPNDLIEIAISWYTERLKTLAYRIWRKRLFTKIRRYQRAMYVCSFRSTQKVLRYWNIRLERQIATGKWASLTFAFRKKGSMFQHWKIIHEKIAKFNEVAAKRHVNHVLKKALHKWRSQASYYRSLDVAVREERLIQIYRQYFWIWRKKRYVITFQNNHLEKVATMARVNRLKSRCFLYWRQKAMIEKLIYVQFSKPRLQSIFSFWKISTRFQSNQRIALSQAGILANHSQITTFFLAWKQKMLLRWARQFSRFQSERYFFSHWIYRLHNKRYEKSHFKQLKISVKLHFTKKKAKYFQGIFFNSP
ncbi:hypothetical protein BC833DRAFT_316214 [Globomyces pollinis-pini]|nr:hypothetical protein BC833DRAFT_316214 [Globomyces pollinis-pini]